MNKWVTGKTASRKSGKTIPVVLQCVSYCALPRSTLISKIVFHEAPFPTIDLTALNTTVLKVFYRVTLVVKILIICQHLKIAKTGSSLSLEFVLVFEGRELWTKRLRLLLYGEKSMKLWEYQETIILQTFLF